MLHIGMTGGIASGKSTAVAMFRDAGCMVLEADPLVHQLLKPGHAAATAVAREFPAAVDATGRVDRAKLGEIVFDDAVKRKRLEQIIHPRVLDATTKWFDALDGPHGPGFAIAEAALMVESDYYRNMDRLIVVWCTPEQQRKRLRARGMTAAQAEKRITAQMSVAKKRQFADDQIDASGSMDSMREQVAQLIAKFKRLAAAKKRPK
jgi:dephospho-CoA kinase